MNKLKYTIKYTEYLAKKCRTLVTSDFHFLRNRLDKYSGKSSKIKSPVTLNEKICYRLLFDKKPIYTFLADKVTVREYVRSRTRLVKTVPLIGIYSSAEHIDFNELPQQFVLKCNHDSGSTIICTNKDTLDIPQTLGALKLALKKNMYYTTREWQYKNIRPAIICEDYIDLFSERNRNFIPEMLRIHCFHGVACFIEADFTDDSGEEFINIYDRSWVLQPFQMEYPNTRHLIPEPESLYQAVTASQELAKGIDYCRVDLMICGKDVYFSEITLSPRRGKLKITPLEWDTKLGGMWHLS
jgi:hypothetical protein